MSDEAAIILTERAISSHAAPTFVHSECSAVRVELLILIKIYVVDMAMYIDTGSALTEMFAVVIL